MACDAAGLIRLTGGRSGLATACGEPPERVLQRVQDAIGRIQSKVSLFISHAHLITAAFAGCNAMVQWVLDVNPGIDVDGVAAVPGPL